MSSDVSWLREIGNESPILSVSMTKDAAVLHSMQRFKAAVEGVAQPMIWPRPAPNCEFNGHFTDCPEPDILRAAENFHFCYGLIADI